MILVFLSLIGLALAIFLFPVTLWRNRLDAEVSEKRAIIAPIKRDIGMRLKGEAAHKAILQAHKENNISIFFELRPIIPMSIQIALMIFALNWASKSKVIAENYLFLGNSVLQWPLLPFERLGWLQVIFVFSLSFLNFKLFYIPTQKTSLFHKPVVILFFCCLISVLPMYISIIFISSFAVQNIIRKYTNL